MSYFSISGFFSSHKPIGARPSDESKSSFLNLSTIKSPDKKTSIYQRLKDMPTLDEKTVKPKEDLDATIIKNSKDSITVHESLQKIKAQYKKNLNNPKRANRYLANMKEEI